MLSQYASEILESKGLKLFQRTNDHILVAKPISTPGNHISSKKSQPFTRLEEIEGKWEIMQDPFETNAPILGMSREEDKINVSVWQWVPGPGPGDFSICVNSEEEAISLVLNYFFENNQYFEAYSQYESTKNK